MKEKTINQDGIKYYLSVIKIPFRCHPDGKVEYWHYLIDEWVESPRTHTNKKTKLSGLTEMSEIDKILYNITD